MKEIAKEIIEIGGVEYTLFLNRKGVIAWEKYAKKEAEVVKALSNKAKEVNLEDVEEIGADTNPFEGLEEIDNIEENNETVSLYFQKLYWIMLYENHKFSLEEVKKLYDEARKEYGEEQLIQLANQMLVDVNVNPNANSEIKNLKALRPTK